MLTDSPKSGRGGRDMASARARDVQPPPASPSAAPRSTTASSVSSSRASSRRIPGSSETELTRRSASRPVVREALAPARRRPRRLAARLGVLCDRRPDDAVLFRPGRLDRRHPALLRIPRRPRRSGGGPRRRALGGGRSPRHQGGLPGARVLHPDRPARRRRGCALSPGDRPGDPQPLPCLRAALARGAHRHRHESHQRCRAPMPASASSRTSTRRSSRRSKSAMRGLPAPPWKSISRMRAAGCSKALCSTGASCGQGA